MEKSVESSKEMRELFAVKLRWIKVFKAHTENVLNKAKLYDNEIYKANLEAAAKTVLVLAKYLESVKMFMYIIQDAF